MPSFYVCLQNAIIWENGSFEGEVNGWEYNLATKAYSIAEETHNFQ